MRNKLTPGAALENAVAIIERIIIESNPELSCQNFTIKQNKIVNVRGVHHEIDLFIEFSNPNGYNYTVIFECKDRTNPVSKNDIIIFERKISDVGAAKGHFVAKTFTADAKAAASPNNRINLVTVNKKIWPKEATSLIPLPLDKNIKYDIEFFALHNGRTGRRRYKSIHSRIQTGRIKHVIYKDRTIPLSDFINILAKHKIDRAHCQGMYDHLSEGEHDIVEDVDVVFEKGDVIIDSVPLRRIHVIVVHKIDLARPELVVHFDIKGRGLSINWGTVRWKSGAEIALQMTAA